ncbi:sensor histidine kinase [Sphingobium amiense]|uniref:histidine kinase n=1 Tax=Sphingobium amiense TaxID=135719 RepID=A0A494W9L8_9SPHN|nr:histidine kinase dimerization/phospho-acceptor domain-containing protein [Sphingobium amiense]BBD97330.1 sensor histidine kinase [Sphingobium amiense]
MRFNDLMQTVLAAGDGQGPNSVTLWRQCVDLLAQGDRAGRGELNEEERDGLLARLTVLRGKLNETQRLATVVELGGRLQSPNLVRFFSEDRPAVAAAAIARARLPDDLWVSLLPQLGPTARGVLRNRKDVGPATRKALEAFGAHDLVLTTSRLDLIGSSDLLLTPEMESADNAPAATVTPLPTAARNESQIRNLVDRIARFTSERRSAEPERPAEPAEARVYPDSFGFETDAAGVVRWVDRGPRAALIGLSLADAAYDEGSGPDGHVAGAFRRRSGFQNGRFTIAGGAMAGEWRVSAAPYFDPQTGRFQGYRGQARRPYAHEVAHDQQAAAVVVAGLSPDSLRQLVHELRTPLNAILGFAEIIEKELFGPAGDQYRDMAGKIVADARHLLMAFDDLDLSAKVSGADDGSAATGVDPALLVTQMASRFRDPGDRIIDVELADRLPHLRIDAVQGERIFQHLFRTVISVAPAGEAIRGRCWFQPEGAGGHVMMALDRPSSLRDIEESALLDPSYDQEGEWPDGPLLGLGFSLRLVRGLAGACGGRLDIAADHFLLTVPAMIAAGELADQA